jgi:dihydroxyacetone kinase-like predicted kinase
VTVTAGAPIALIDDELTLTAETPEDAVLAALTSCRAGTLITLYPGRDTKPDRSEQLLTRLRERFPDTEIESYPGGQPFYDYVVSVE